MTPGIHNLTNEAYHAAAGISKTGLWTIATKTPAHFKFGEREDSPAFDLGTAVHTAVLEPERLDATIICGPEDRRGNKWKDAQLAAEAQGATVLTLGDYDRVRRMRDSADRNTTLVELRRGALIEHAGVAVDPETGVLCRCKPDAFNAEMGIILDLKSSVAGGRDEFARSVANYGYHVQEAYYTDVWSSAWVTKLHYEGKVEEMHNGIPVVQGFVFVVIEKTAPFLVSCYELHPNAVEEGRAAYRSALTTYAECLQNEAAGMAPHLAWPGYPDRPEPLDLPRWAYRHTTPSQEI